MIDAAIIPLKEHFSALDAPVLSTELSIYYSILS